MRSLALDFQRHNIRVNAVAPGFTETGLTAGMMDNEKFLERMHSRIPMGRGGQPEGNACVVAFPATEDASFVNGVILPVDGGLTASKGQPSPPERRASRAGGVDRGIRAPFACAEFRRSGSGSPAEGCPLTRRRAKREVDFAPRIGYARH